MAPDHAVSPPLSRERLGARVVIVGGAGALGRRFAQWFARDGDHVWIVDPRAEQERQLIESAGQGRLEVAESLEAVVSSADLVVIAVPIHLTPTVIADLPPLPPESILADLTSVKSPAMQAMLTAHSGAVVGLHPMFGPDITEPSGEVVVHSPGRGQNLWLLDRLDSWGVRLETVPAAEHDRLMGIIQALRHTVTFAYGADLLREHPDVETLLALSSPIYRLELMMVGRLFAQDADLYYDIITASDQNLELLEHFHSTLGEVIGTLRAGDRERFVEDFARVADFFQGHSADFMAESRELLAVSKQQRGGRADHSSIARRGA